MERGDRGEEAFIAKFTGPWSSASRTKYTTEHNRKSQTETSSAIELLQRGLFVSLILLYLFVSITSNLNCISMKINSYTQFGNRN